MSKTPFDPAEHTVPEVVDHLDKHPDDRDRVLAAEADGKARVGVLGTDASDAVDGLGRAVVGGRDYLGREV